MGTRNVEEVEGECDTCIYMNLALTDPICTSCRHGSHMPTTVTNYVSVTTEFCAECVHADLEPEKYPCVTCSHCTQDSSVSNFEKAVLVEDIVSTPSAAMDQQVGGDHYKEKDIQPFDVTYSNFGYEGIRASVCTKINKYLGRTKESHRQDIGKAIHCLQIQLQFLDKEEAA